MFEVERIDGGIKFRYNKDAPHEITDAVGERLYGTVVDLLRMVKIPDANDIFQALEALKQKPSLKKVRAREGAVVELTFEPDMYKLPPVPQKVSQPGEIQEDFVDLKETESS